MIKVSDIIIIKGNGYIVQFDIKIGIIYSLIYGNEKVIIDGNGLKLDVFCVFINNDNWFYLQWFDNGLYNLKYLVIGFNMIIKEDGIVVLLFIVQFQVFNVVKILGGISLGKNKIEELIDKKFGSSDFKFIINQVWIVYKDGFIELEVSIIFNQLSFVLFCLGYMVCVFQ